MADTPRDPPGLNEQWSDEISALLSQWGEVSLCYSWLHNYSQRKYKRKYHHMSIPIIVVSTLMHRQLCRLICTRWRYDAISNRLGCLLAATPHVLACRALAAQQLTLS